MLSPNNIEWCLLLLLLPGVFYALSTAAHSPPISYRTSQVPCYMTVLLLSCSTFSDRCRLALLAMLIAFYIVVAVAVAQTTNAGTQHVSRGAAWKCVPHPSWAWWLVSQLGRASFICHASYDYRASYVCHVRSVKQVGHASCEAL